MLEQIVWQQIEWVNIYAFSFSRFSPVRAHFPHKL